MDDNKLAILTGPRGIGKTQLLFTLTSDLVEQGRVVKGVLSPAIITNGQIIGKEIYNIYSRERKILATMSDHLPDGVKTLKYSFNSRTIEWANDLFSQNEHIDILIVDEIGPLELKMNSGLQKAVNMIVEKKYNKAIVVVRQELIDQILKSWNVSTIFTITKTNYYTQSRRDLLNWINS